MNYGAILAGGIGNRMKSAKIPKQFLLLGGKPVIIRTIEKLQAVSALDEIVVAIHPEWTDYLQELIDAHGVSRHNLCIINGGAERLDTILNVVKAIEDLHGIQASDKIVVHDAVRPFITERIVLDSLDALEQHSAVVAATPATDTMLWIEEGTLVKSMPDRSKLFHGQAPDSFRLSVLRDSLYSLTDEERKVITGTAQICFVRNIAIHTIPGDVRNMKLTTDEDMVIAEGLIEREINN